MMAYVYPSDSATKLILALIFAAVVLLIIEAYWNRNE